MARDGAWPARWKFSPLEIGLLIATMLLKLGAQWLDSVAWEAFAVVAFFGFAVALPIRLLARHPREYHRAHPFILLFGAALALVMPTWTYSEHGLLTANGDIVKSFWDCAYFSAVTWATLGYGDIRPTGWGKLIAACHSLVGYAYMALIVAFLVKHFDFRASKTDS